MQRLGRVHGHLRFVNSRWHTQTNNRVEEGIATLDFVRQTPPLDGPQPREAIVRRRYRLSQADIELVRQFLQNDALLTPLTVEVHGVATHPEDDLILATALSGQADYLVTGDRQLLNLGSYQGVTILTPRSFLELLTSEDPGGAQP